MLPRSLVHCCWSLCSLYRSINLFYITFCYPLFTWWSFVFLTVNNSPSLSPELVLCFLETDCYYKQNAESDKGRSAAYWQANWPYEWGFGCNGYSKVRHSRTFFFWWCMVLKFLQAVCTKPKMLQVLCLGKQFSVQGPNCTWWWTILVPEITAPGSGMIQHYTTFLFITSL